MSFITSDLHLLQPMFFLSSTNLISCDEVVSYHMHYLLLTWKSYLPSKNTNGPQDSAACAKHEVTSLRKWKPMKLSSRFWNANKQKISV